MGDITDKFRVGNVTDDYIMPFGKYNGHKLIDVPAQYLIWLYDQKWAKQKFGNLCAYIDKNRETLEFDADSSDEEFNDRDRWDEYGGD